MAYIGRHLRRLCKRQLTRLYWGPKPFAATGNQLPRRPAATGEGGIISDGALSVKGITHKSLI